MIIPIDEPSRIARKLVQMDEAGVHADELFNVVRGIDNLDLLFDVAGNAVHSLAAIRAIYRRSEELGAAQDRARGFLALAHLFAGEDETAKAIVGSPPKGCVDPVLWQAWALTSWDTDTQIERLKAGIDACPQAQRLWRQLATTALTGQREDEAARAHQWLISNEQDLEERQRLQATMIAHGWLKPDVQ